MEHVAAVYRMFDVAGQLLYIGVTRNFGQRWKEHGQEQDWWGDVYRLTVIWYETRAAADEAEAEAIRTEPSVHNKSGSPWQMMAKDGRTGFYIVPKVNVKTIYKLRDGTAREHAMELARQLRDKEGLGDPLLPSVLRGLEQVIGEHLAGNLEPLGFSVDMVDPRRVRMREIMAGRGADGVTVRELQTVLGGEGRNVARETIHRWLAEDEQEGLAVRPPANSAMNNRRWRVRQEAVT